MALLAVVSVVWWNAAHQLPPQFITLPNGEQYRFAGATFGTNAVPPSLLIHIIRLLPKPLADRANKYFGVRVTHAYISLPPQSPQLFLWFQWAGTNTPPPNAIASDFLARQYGITVITAELADESGLTGGGRIAPYLGTNVGWSLISFPVFPRRSRNLECLFWVRPGMDPLSLLGKITVRNPVYRHYPLWQPEPMPTVRQADGLDVRLDGVMVGSIGDGMTMYTNANGALAQKIGPGKASDGIGAQIAYSVRAGRGTNEAWVCQSTELTDATGNSISPMVVGFSMSLTPGIMPRETFDGWRGSAWNMGSLWPGEAAWRLKMEFKRSAGFKPEEVITFKGVPLPPLGVAQAVDLTNFAGTQTVVLTTISRQADLPAMWGSWSDFGKLSTVRIEIPAEPAGQVLDLVEVDTDDGPPNPFLPGDVTGHGHNFRFASVPTNATRMDLVFALQKPRTVEFIFQPPPTTNWGK
jgi:hypothetical protein